MHALPLKYRTRSKKLMFFCICNPLWIPGENFRRPGPLLHPLIPPLYVCGSCHRICRSRIGLQSHLRKCLRKCTITNTMLNLWTRLSDNANTIHNACITEQNGRLLPVYIKLNWAYQVINMSIPSFQYCYTSWFLAWMIKFKKLVQI